MPAYFETGFFVREPAWHRMGNVVQHNITDVQEAIKEAGLDWQVLERPLTTTVLTDEGECTLPVPGQKCLVRSTDHSILGVVGNGYRPVQNINAFEFFNPLLQEGQCYLETAGSLFRGKRIWVLANVKGQVADVLPEDAVRQYLLLYNSHDGSTSLGFKFVNERVVCSNTLSIAMNESSRVSTEDSPINNATEVRLRHQGNMAEKLARVQTALNLARQQFNMAIEQYKTMANTQMNTELFRRYLEILFEKELTVAEGEEPKTLDDVRATRRITELFETESDLQTPGVRGTAWAAYNAVTSYATHYAGRGQGDAADEQRLNRVWFGEGAKLIERAHTLALTF